LAFVRAAALAARVLEVPAVSVHVVAPLSAENTVDLVVRPDGSTAAPDHGSNQVLAAEVPLESSGGARIGWLGVQDRATRRFTRKERRILGELGRIIADEVVLEGLAVRGPWLGRAPAPLENQDTQDVAAVAMAMRSMSDDDDPSAVRHALCQVALQLTGADSAMILDITGTNLRLVQSAFAGRRWRTAPTSVSDADSPAARAYRGGRTIVVPNERTTQLRSHDRARTWVEFTIWQPLAAGGRSTAAVVALAWQGPLTTAADRLVRLSALMAAEASIVLERADLLARLGEQARTDELTGLPNRRAVQEVLVREIQRAKRQGGPLCIGLLDLDFFKRFNDTHGHPAGDRLLAESATAWREALRAGSDTLGRYGGEEFLLVLPAPIDEALLTVERLRKLTRYSQTVSAGVAIWDGAESAEALVARSDIALYVAKAGGRDRTELASNLATAGESTNVPIGVFEHTPGPGGEPEPRSRESALASRRARPT
jgi:diguanylate cyclase (GGDEF)-like protein